MDVNGPWQLSVPVEWGSLERVALVRPGFFRLTAPINVTQRRFYAGANPPDVERLGQQHEGVRAALHAAGVQVVDVAPDRRFPLQFNIRDAAVVVGSRCVLTRMRRDIRAGEPDAVRRALGADRPVQPIPSGTLEGGDVTVTRDEVYVGLSERTDERGLDHLRRLVGPDRTVTPIRLAPDVLHLDVAMNLLGPDVGVIHRASVRGDLPDSLRGVDWVEATDEEYADQGVNVLSLGPRRVLFDGRHPRLAAELHLRGYECVPVELDEITKVGGGVRCMTLPLTRS